MDRERSRELKRSVRDAQRLTFIERMPILSALAVKMFDHLDEQIGAQGCNHDFQHISRWCTEQSIDGAAVTGWLRSEGAGCDCEALANVDDQLADAVEAFR